MAESFIQNIFAERIGGPMFGKDTTVYKFEKIKRAKRKALQDKPDRPLLDFGVGEPDKRPSDDLCSTLYMSAINLDKHGYTDTGTDKFKKAVVGFMDRMFGVSELIPSSHVLPTIGSKEALANFPKCFVNPGDVVLMTTPGYPVLGTNAEYLGGKVYNMPLLPENDFYPDFDALPADIVSRAKILYLNYPNNPTGKCASREFFEQVVAFAKEHNIVVVQDAPYINLVFDREPLSILSVPGGMDVAIELHSFSKSYSMTGWRLGFAVGNELLISALAAIKDNTDSGCFEAIQHAGIYALEHAEIIDNVVGVYERRLRLLVDTLVSVGLSASMPEGTFYLFVPVPREMRTFDKNERFETAEDFTRFLIENYGIVTVPWDDNGTPFVRFSATFTAADAADEVAQMEEMRRRLEGITFLN